jgi:protein O-GlcNAc transferase
MRASDEQEQIMASIAIRNKLQETENRYLAGDIARASALGQEVIDADPGNAEAWHLSGLIHFTAGQPQESESRIRRAIRLDSSAVHFKANLAVVLLNRQQPAEAENLCREMLRVDSKHTKTLASLGTALRQQQRRAESLSVFEKAVDLERDAHALCNLATILTDLGRLDEAHELLLEARELNPELSEVHKNLAIVHRERPLRTGLRPVANRSLGRIGRSVSPCIVA